MLKNNNAKFAFLYMFSLVALLFVALGTGQVLFQAINKFIADFVTPGLNSFNSGSLKFAISALIIAIPLYYITMYFLEKNLQEGNLDKDSGIRRWLIYFILFVTSVVMIIWLMMTIGSYLDGELTTKFMLKALSAIVIAGIIFSYYFYDIRRDKVKGGDLVVRIYFIATLLITVGSLVFSFFFVESPREARARIHDMTIVSQFTEIDSAINTYFTKTKKVPENLAQTVQETPYLVLSNYKDPLTGKEYEYKKTSDTSYELCADFMTDNRDPKNQNGDYTYSDRWPHATGYQCLKQNALDYNQVDNGLKAAPVK